MKFNADRLIFAVALIGYGGFALSLGNGPMQDVPNHLARIHIIADLLFNGGAVYGAEFGVQLLFRPYLLPDLLLAIVDHVAGVSWVARIWALVAVAIIPLGALFALRSMQLPPRAVLIGSLLSFYVATGWTFAMGFLNYQVAFGCALFAYGWFVRAQTSNRFGVWLGFALTALLSYSMHLSGLVFLCALVGVEGAIRSMRALVNVRRFVLLCSIPALLLVLHIALRMGGDQSLGNNTWWASPHDKVVGLLKPAFRFRVRFEILLFVAFLGAVLLPLAGRSPLRAVRAAVLPWCCVAAFIALYFALPTSADNISFVDIRALPFAMVFAAIAGVSMAAAMPERMRWQLALTGILVAANLAYAVIVMKADDRRVAAYRDLASFVPPGSRVLPVQTLARTWPYDPILHAGCFITIQRNALTPYLFAADMNPPMSYFQYSHARAYAPDEYWYRSAVQAGVDKGVVSPVMPDWKQVEQEYDFLFVTVPWDSRLIPDSYEVVARNEVAALLRIPGRPAQ